MAELIAAAQRAKLDEVRRLLGRGVDASAADFSNGETALHAVCCANHNPMSERARVAVVRELLNNGADANARGRYDWTPLHYACWRGHDEIVTLLLQAGGDPEARTHRRTPSHLPAGTAATAGDTPRDQAQKVGHMACVMAIDAFQARVHYGLGGTDCAELGPGGGGQFKPAATGALPSGSRHLAADDGRVQHVGHSRPCLDESHLHPPPAWGGVGDSVGSLLRAEPAPASAAATRTPSPAATATPAPGQSLGASQGEQVLSRAEPNSWRRPARDELPDRRGAAEAHRKHHADDSHAQGTQSAAWLEGQGLDSATEGSNVAGWSEAYCVSTPRLRRCFLAA